jgi:hypothetical protein
MRPTTDWMGPEQAGVVACAREKVAGNSNKPRKTLALWKIEANMFYLSEAKGRRSRRWGIDGVSPTCGCDLQAATALRQKVTVGALMISTPVYIYDIFDPCL